MSCPVFLSQPRRSTKDHKVFRSGSFKKASFMELIPAVLLKQKPKRCTKASPVCLCVPHGPGTTRDDTFTSWSISLVRLQRFPARALAAPCVWQRWGNSITFPLWVLGRAECVWPAKAQFNGLLKTLKRQTEMCGWAGSQADLGDGAGLILSRVRS